MTVGEIIGFSIIGIILLGLKLLDSAIDEVMKKDGNVS